MAGVALWPASVVHFLVMNIQRFLMIIIKRTYLQKHVELLAIQCWKIAMPSADHLGALLLTLLPGRLVIYPTAATTHTI